MADQVGARGRTPTGFHPASSAGNLSVENALFLQARVGSDRQPGADAFAHNMILFTFARGRAWYLLLQSAPSVHLRKWMCGSEVDQSDWKASYAKTPRTFTDQLEYQ